MEEVVRGTRRGGGGGGGSANDATAGYNTMTCSVRRQQLLGREGERGTLEGDQEEGRRVAAEVEGVAGLESAGEERERQAGRGRDRRKGKGRGKGGKFWGTAGLGNRREAGEPRCGWAIVGQE